MKESYGESVAIHTDPESCGLACKGGVEALTGARAGRVSSRERIFLRGADAVRRSGRLHLAHRYREMRRDPARSKAPCTYGHTSHENREILCPPQRMTPRDALGSPRTYADDERAWEVGQARSTREVPEQRRATGHGGEGRGLAKGNLRQQNLPIGHSAGTGRPSALERVPQAASRDRTLRFTALLHHVYDLDALRAASLRLKREAAPGVDGETWRHYGEALEANL